MCSCRPLWMPFLLLGPADLLRISGQFVCRLAQLLHCPPPTNPSSLRPCLQIQLFFWGFPRAPCVVREDLTIRSDLGGLSQPGLLGGLQGLRRGWGMEAESWLPLSLWCLSQTCALVPEWPWLQGPWTWNGGWTSPQRAPHPLLPFLCHRQSRLSGY